MGTLFCQTSLIVLVHYSPRVSWPFLSNCCLSAAINWVEHTPLRVSQHCVESSVDPFSDVVWYLVWQKVPSRISKGNSALQSDMRYALSSAAAVAWFPCWPYFESLHSDWELCYPLSAQHWSTSTKAIKGVTLWLLIDSDLCERYISAHRMASALSRTDENWRLMFKIRKKSTLQKIRNLNPRKSGEIALRGAMRTFISYRKSMAGLLRYILSISFLLI
jgi:hypothetical protein